MQPIVRQRGCLLKQELHQIARWKAARSAPRTLGNSPRDVREITHTAFEASSEQLRIGALLILEGVGWPTASVILHFYHHDPYPVLDFRALWSCRLHVPGAYRFTFWQRYVEFCRKIARRNGVDMRTLDRALWQYSKENQRSTRRCA